MAISTLPTMTIGQPIDASAETVDTPTISTSAPPKISGHVKL